MSDTKFSTGAVRSADADKFSFTSLPMVGLLALARTAGEGAEKYGRFNYLQGMPLHDLMEHSFKHLVMYNAGDRSEPHLAHAAWGLLVAIQEEVMRPEAHAAHMLGAGCSITPAVQAHMDEQKPILAANRAERGPDAFTWNIFDLPDVLKLCGQRDGVKATLYQLKVNEAERQSIKDAIVKGPPLTPAFLPEQMVFGQWSAGAYQHSTGNPVVDAWLNEGGAAFDNWAGDSDRERRGPDGQTLPYTSKADPVFDAKGFPPIPDKKKPRTDGHVPVFHSDSPLATRQQNNAPRPAEHVQGEPTNLRTPAEAFAASIKSTPGGYFPRS